MTGRAAVALGKVDNQYLFYLDMQKFFSCASVRGERLLAQNQSKSEKLVTCLTRKRQFWRFIENVSSRRYKIIPVIAAAKTELLIFHIHTPSSKINEKE